MEILSLRGPRKCNFSGGARSKEGGAAEGFGTFFQKLEATPLSRNSCKNMLE